MDTPSDNTVTVILRRYALTAEHLDSLAAEHYGRLLETAAFNDPGVFLYEFLPSSLEGHAPTLAKEAIDHARTFQRMLDSTFLVRKPA